MKKTTRLQTVLGIASADAQALFDSLTPAEREAVELLAKGSKVEEISSALGKSPKTIAVQLAAARFKLKARNYVEMVRVVYAAQLGE
ncbi:MAG: helix-turn-helix transcriptional regulator [Gemmataceae bacterium]|nr:helix-turn-helix transcriptional regulator [Gemmataceae bacterium]